MSATKMPGRTEAWTRTADTFSRLAMTAVGVTGTLAVILSASLVWLYVSQPLTVAQKAGEGGVGALVSLLAWAVRTVAAQIVRYF